MTVTEQEYVLGTHDEEVQRLGVQHRVWRPHMLDAWAAAGITEGSRVVDLGCGPGYTTLDLAELVGPSGEVLAIEREPRFVAIARNQCAQRGFTHVQVLQADVTDELPVTARFDVVWSRWVAMFVPDLARFVARVAAALRPGGCAVFHEYVYHATWQTIPPLAAVPAFLTEALASIRAAGGEPDVAISLLPLLCQAGFEIVETTPLLFMVTPTEALWHWPWSLLRTYPRQLVERGRVGEAWRQQVEKELTAFEQSPNVRMLTPTVLQLIVRKR